MNETTRKFRRGDEYVDDPKEATVYRSVYDATKARLEGDVLAALVWDHFGQEHWEKWPFLEDH